MNANELMQNLKHIERYPHDASDAIDEIFDAF